MIRENEEYIHETTFFEIEILVFEELAVAVERDQHNQDSGVASHNTLPYCDVSLKMSL